MRLPKFLALFLFFLVLSSLAAAQAKLEKLGALSDAAVPAAARSAVASSGARLVRPDGSVLCEIWLGSSLPAPKGTAAAGALYTDLAPGEFVGMIAFPNGGKDFRGQAIKPGFYTMRYELLPEDGNHMGVAPTRDFVLLARVGDDNDPNAQYDFAQLVKLSALAAGTNHPAAFVLLDPRSSPPNASGGTAPGAITMSTYQNPEGYLVFSGLAKTGSGKYVPLALVVKGQAEQ